MRKLLVVVALLGLVAAGCGDSDDGGESSTADAPPVSLPGPTNDHGTAKASGTLALELDDNYYAPTYVEADANQEITVELANEGANPHTFTSTALGVDEEVSPGQSKTVTIKAPGNGFSEFHCRFHQSGGMQGAVFVG